MTNQQSIDHHFVPQFYLKRWAGADGRVCEFARPHRELIASSKTPKTTGYQKHLYTVPGLPPEKQSVLEDVVLKQIDQIGSDALDFMLGNPTGEKDMPNKLRCGWSRFLMSLMHRSPQKLAALKAGYSDFFKQYLLDLESWLDRDQPYHENFEGAAATFKEDMAEVGWARLFEMATDYPQTGAMLNQMHWSIATIGNPEHHLLTSDHPLVKTDGIKHPEGYVITPVGPTQVFIAVNSAEMAGRIAKTDPRYLVPKLNDTMVRQAVDYVYDTDERQRCFVNNRFRLAS